MGEKTLVDDSDSGGAVTIRFIDILHPVISSRAVYLHTFLVAIDNLRYILYTLIQRIVYIYTNSCMKYRIDNQGLMDRLSAWNGFLKKDVHLIACGGTALTLLGIKASTKDIDLITRVRISSSISTVISF